MYLSLGRIGVSSGWILRWRLKNPQPHPVHTPAKMLKAASQLLETRAWVVGSKWLGIARRRRSANQKLLGCLELNVWGLWCSLGKSYVRDSMHGSHSG